MRVDDFYFFMKKRESVRMAKETGKPWPWTDDPILQEYKFTNVKREHDATSRKLAAHYRQHVPHSTPDIYLFNCALARYFGRWETIHLLGWQDTFQPEYLKHTTGEMLRQKQKVFTGAYVITNQGMKAPKHEVVVDFFLRGLWDARKSLAVTAQKTDSWEAVSRQMYKLNGFGGMGFMTKEVLLDTMFVESFWPTGLKPKDFNFWSPAGPGARRGLNRVHRRPVKGRIVPKQVGEEILEIYRMRWEHWPSEWVHLELQDIQFQLCEFDKYERVRLGEGRPRSKYQNRGAERGDHHTDLSSGSESEDLGPA